MKRSFMFWNVSTTCRRTKVRGRYLIEGETSMKRSFMFWNVSTTCRRTKVRGRCLIKGETNMKRRTAADDILSFIIKFPATTRITGYILNIQVQNSGKCENKLLDLL